MMLSLVALSMMAVCLSSPAQDVTHVDASTPRELQVRIAKLAAPREITERADIYVLGKHGYELAEPGDSGFSCLIEREKPDTMEPECYDLEGTRTTLKVRFYQEQQRATGVSEQEIQQSVKAGYESGKFKPPSKAGIVYMLSDYNYVLNPETGKVIHFPGHLMFYAPYATEKTVGSGAGAPYIVHPGQPDALMIVVPANHH
jgi:hypothetical protein